MQGTVDYFRTGGKVALAMCAPVSGPAGDHKYTPGKEARVMEPGDEAVLRWFSAPVRGVGRHTALITLSISL
jgi:hypothetical protein